MLSAACAKINIVTVFGKICTKGLLTGCPYNVSHLLVRLDCENQLRQNLGKSIAILNRSSGAVSPGINLST